MDVTVGLSTSTISTSLVTASIVRSYLCLLYSKMRVNQQIFDFSKLVCQTDIGFEMALTATVDIPFDKESFELITQGAEGVRTVNIRPMNRDSIKEHFWERAFL